MPDHDYSDELHRASQGLQKAAALVDDEEFTAFLRSMNDELNDRWREFES